MEPRIQYTKTSDGVSIAFWTIGKGVPLVHMAIELPMSHIQIEWQVPEIRRWYERLAEQRMVVRYDGRATGLSERDIADYSLENCLLDLEAVADRIGSQRFALLASFTCSLIAVAYAARHPERVSHLILWCGFARGSDSLTSTRVRALEALMPVDWKAATETWARIMMGDADEPRARLAAAFLRVSISPQVMRAGIEAFREVDVSPLLPLVTAPTLVLWRRQIPSWDSERIARQLVSGIPDARLTLLEGTSGSPWDDMEAVLAAIGEFLGEGEPAPVGAEPPAAGGFCTILFTDVEGSTALTERLGDAKAREVLREHERIVREALRAHGGAEVKALGDGFMASFSAATKALECAIAMQRAFAAQSDEHPETPIRVRIGLNAGEPIAEDQDLFGTAVILAARIAAQAKGKEILVSDVVRQLVAGEEFVFSDRGEVPLKGFEDPVRLYAVQWGESW